MGGTLERFSYRYDQHDERTVNDFRLTEQMSKWVYEAYHSLKTRRKKGKNNLKANTRAVPFMSPDTQL